MKKNIILKSKQIYENEEEQSEIKQEAEIIYENKNIIIEFIQIVEQEKIPYKITINQDSVTYIRAENAIYLEKNKETITKYNTQYGYINMNTTLSKLKVERNGDQISRILLEYDIQMENTAKYKNIIVIEIM